MSGELPPAEIALRLFLSSKDQMQPWPRFWEGGPGSSPHLTSSLILMTASRVFPLGQHWPRGIYRGKLSPLPACLLWKVVPSAQLSLSWTRAWMFRGRWFRASKRYWWSHDIPAEVNHRSLDAEVLSEWLTQKRGHNCASSPTTWREVPCLLQITTANARHALMLTRFTRAMPTTALLTLLLQRSALALDAPPLRMVFWYLASWKLYRCVYGEPLLMERLIKASIVALKSRWAWWS